MPKNNGKKQDRGYDKRVINLRRVAKVTAGGKRLRFSAMVAVGDRKGSVGVALGRGVDTRSAVEKAERKAVSTMKKIQLVGDTIPHELLYKKGAAQVLLRPAKPGSGIIAGSSARTVLELAGIENVYCKQLGSHELVANAYCTFEALMKLRNDRVMKKMKIMRDRVGLKEKMDEERKKREAKMRAKDRKNKRGSRRDDKRKGNKNPKKVVKAKVTKKEDGSGKDTKKEK